MRSATLSIPALLAAAILSASPAQNSLSGLWRAIAADASGKVGVAALILESGQHAALNGSSHFPTQSVYKLPIVLAALQKVDQGTLRLDQTLDIRPDVYVPNNKYSPLRDQFPQGTRKTIRELIDYALVESDGTASDVLLKLAGGPEAVTTYLKSLGVNDFVVANAEHDMNWQTQYDDWCTPEAAVQILGIVQKGALVSAASRALVLQDLEKSKPGINRIRRLLPSGTIVADKTGASGTQNSIAAATNDIGLVTLPDGRHLALAIFVSDSTAPAATRDDVIAKIARATWDAWLPAK
jgi:beta-lactamase class A